MSEKSRRKALARQGISTQQQINQVTVAGSFAGPLPPPNMLANYNQAFDGCAERIVAMAEKQSEHRQQLEKRALEAGIIGERRGSIFGFIAIMTAILGGVLLIAIGKSVDGLATVITSLVAFASVFFYGRYQQRKERKEKLSALNL
jgi:uncharacterized membrane protein